MFISPYSNLASAALYLCWSWRIFAGFAVHLQQFRHVELGLLEDLDFTHMNLVKGVGGRSGFGDVDVGFDFSLPFFDHGALFVAGELHTVKVSETSVSLGLFAHKAEFTVLRFVTVEISLVDLVDAATETIGGELGSRRSSD